MTSALRHDEASVLTADAAPQQVDGTLRSAFGSSAGPGRYVVLGPLGEGAMGTVLRAYDPKLHREVALKQLRSGALDEAERAALVQEAQAMAQLRHPHVVQVYDVETTAAQAVLVMELVPGRTLRAWLDEQARTWREIVRIFSAAGEGLAAAHQVNLVHRDFKPANVLVREDGVPKVSDFGLATTSELRTQCSPRLGIVERDLDTRESIASRMVVGTPRYMAPEQHAGEPATAAADQFAFCVALWEALCGAPPFAGKQLAQDKANGPPPWPGQVRVPLPLVRAIMHGLSAAPEHRFARMEDLLDVLSRSLSRAPTRLTWLAGAAVAAAATAGLGSRIYLERAQVCSGAAQHLHGVWDAHRRAEIEAAFSAMSLSYARETMNRTLSSLDGYGVAWQQQHQEACEATSVRGEQSPHDMDLRMLCLSRAKEHLAAAVSVLIAADDIVLEKAHAVVSGLPDLQRCGDVQALKADVPLPRDPALAQRVQAAYARLAEARTLRRAGKYSDALTIGEALLPEAEVLSHAPLTAEIHLVLGDTLDAMGQSARAENSLRRAFVSSLGSRRWEEAARAATFLGHMKSWTNAEDAQTYASMAVSIEERPDADPAGLALASSTLGWALDLRGQHEAGEKLQRKALQLWQSASGDHRVEISDARNLAAGALYNQGKRKEAKDEVRRALEMREQVLGPEHPAVAMARHNLGYVLVTLGEYEDAEVEIRTALRLFGGALPPRHAHIATAHAALANLLALLGRGDEAETEARAVLTSLPPNHGPRHAVIARLALAEAFMAQKRYVEAEQQYRESLQQTIAELGPEHLDSATSRAALMNALRLQGRFAEALREGERVLAAMQQSMGLEHQTAALARSNFALVLHAVGRHLEAQQHASAAVKSLESEFGDAHPDVLVALVALGETLIGGAEFAAAETALTRAVVLAEQHPLLRHRAGAAEFALARLAWGQGERARALDLAQRAAQSFERAGASNVVDRDEVLRWIETRTQARRAAETRSRSAGRAQLGRVAGGPSRR